ncbi:MAG: hypothetical protein K1X92_15235 [Bacteroidia bacterium]|nr:hypothetical protein [Bacteroidia bacterium]
MLRKLKIYGVILFSGAILSAWFFHKINPRHFYTHYFRMIEEINDRNSQSIEIKSIVLDCFLGDWKPVSKITSIFTSFLSEETREIRFFTQQYQYSSVIFPSFSFLFKERLHSLIRLDYIPLSFR